MNFWRAVKIHQSDMKTVKARRVSHRSKHSPVSAASKRQRESVQGQAEANPDQLVCMSPIVETDDEYAYLRYQDDKPQDSSPIPETCHPLFPTHIVYVRRPKTRGKSPEPPTPSRGLPLPVGPAEEPMEVYNATSTSLVHQTTQAIHREVEKAHYLQQSNQRALAAQEAALHTWGKTLQARNVFRDQMAHTDRAQGTLLLDRTLALPPIQDHLAASLGPGSDFPRWKQEERSYLEDAFFRQPERLGPEDEGMTFTLPWSQRNLYMPPLTLARPDLGEEPEFVDPTGRTSKLSEAQKELKMLKVTGTKVQEEHEPEPRVETPVGESTDSITLLKMSSSFSGKRMTRPFSPQPCSNRLQSPYYVRIYKPAFMLGRFTYVWGQPCLQDMVEVGVVSNAGEQGITHIRLANVGCCVMRYSWRRLPHHDHFNTGRYRLSPFIFNAADGTLLPEEKLSLPVQFFSRYAGRWTEQWLLRTTPCVFRGKGGEGEIALSLWGQAMEVDVNLTNRLTLDKELLDSAVLRMAQRYTWDLVRLLPIRSSQQQAADQRMALMAAQTVEVGDPVGDFKRRNPKLHYHSAGMLRLTSARSELLNEIRVLAERAEIIKALEQEGRLTPVSSIKSASPCADKMSLKPRDKSSRTHKISESRSFGPVPPTTRTRQKSVSGSRGSRRPPSNFFNSSLSSTNEMEEVKVVLQPVPMDQVHREAFGLEEESDKKEEILQSINEAVLLMSRAPCTPVARHHKLLLMRSALVQLCDTLSALEWRLRSDLDLLEDPVFEKLTTFPNLCQRVTKDVKKPGGGKERRKVTKQASKKAINKEKELQPEKEPVDWTVEVYAQYHVKLTALVHQLLLSTLDSMQPLILCDGYHLDLLKPPPKV